ncbi:MAG: MBL fold hydrolase [Candidatus Hydrogenedentota bacterium]
MDIIALPMTPFVTNCFVLRDADEALIVDPGDVTPELLEAIDGFTVRTVVNTHCHCDHCGGNAEILKRTGAELICHKDEVPLLRNLVQQGLMFGVPFDPSPEPDRFIQEGDTVSVGGVSLGVREAPGHSPGHIVLVGDGFVIGGDVLFAGSIGRTDLPGGSYPQLIQSIKTKLLTLPDETVVYSGHGPATTIGVERRTNPFLVGA